MGVRVLGPVEVDGGEALRPRDRLVLAALAVRRGLPTSPDVIADAVWGEHAPASWSKQVQICIGRLRKVLGAGAIVTGGDGYRLVPEGVELDTDRFEDLIERADRFAGEGEADRAATALSRALALVRGEPFAALEGWGPARAEALRITEMIRSAEDDLLAAGLAGGEHREVASRAETLVARDPLRERRWAALALAQYRCGRQADALGTLRRAATMLREQLGIDPGPELADLQQRILRQDASLAARPVPRPRSSSCPYKGLPPLEAGDPMFGRDKEIADCLARIGERRFLVVAGPSGSGKSSLVRAGVVPSLERRGRRCLVVVPDQNGGLALPDQGESAALLVVDQVEEVFAAGRPALSVRETCASLATFATHRAPVLLVVRGDHLADLAADPGLGRLVEGNLHLLSPMTGDALREAIERPAVEAGYRLESGLVDLVVRDVEGEPGALPLMAHALAETWRRRDGAVLTVEGYRASGGIAGAVAQSADRLYESLSATEREALRSVLLRLVVPASDGEPLRCRVPRRVLLGDPVREDVTARLVAARLLTAGADVVEISHEAMVRAWPRLRAWLDEDAAGLRLLRHLTVTAEGWESLGRPEGELYRGARLEAAEEYRRSALPDLTPVERDFLGASLAAAESERDELRHRAHLDARRNRRLRLLLAVATSLLLVAAAAGTVAVRRAGDARRAATEASLEALVNRSLALRATDRDVAALLAVEAVRRQPDDPRALSALLGTFTASPGFVANVYVPDAERLSGATLHGRRQALVARDSGRVAVLDTETGRLVREFERPDVAAVWTFGTAVSADGRRAVVVVALSAEDCGDPTTAVLDNGSACAAFLGYDVPSGRLLGDPVALPDGAAGFALDPRGARVAVVGSQSGEVTLHRVRGGALLAGFPGTAGSVTFGGDGRLYVGSDDGRVRRAGARGRWRDTWRGPPGHADQHVSVGADGVLVAGGPRGLVALDTGTGRRLWTADLRGGGPDPCPWWAVSEASQRVYCGSHYGEIEERDRASGQRTGRVLDTQLGDVGDLALTPDGAELLVFGAQAPVVTRWRLDGSGPVSRRVADGHIAADRFAYDDADTLLVARRPPDATVFDDFTDFAVWDTVQDRLVDDVTVDLELGLQGMGWVGPDLLTGMDVSRGRYRWYSTQSRGLVGGDVIGTECEHLFAAAAPGEPAFCGGARGQVWTIAPANREITAPFIQVAGGFVASASATRGGARVVVTVWTEDGPATTVHDGRTGAMLAGPVGGPEATFVGLDGDLFGTSGGSITRYDLDTLQRLGDLPGARGEVNSMQISLDGRLLMATSNDQSAALYDVATGIRLGDPIATSAPLAYAAFLSPDGRSLAVTDAAGVVVWDLDPEQLLAAACRVAGRNLTRTEWSTYLDGPYRATCPVVRARA